MIVIVLLLFISAAQYLTVKASRPTLGPNKGQLSTKTRQTAVQSAELRETEQRTAAVMKLLQEPFFPHQLPTSGSTRLSEQEVTGKFGQCAVSPN